MRQSKEIIETIERAKEIAKNRNDYKVGSEHLLLAMMSDEKSACHFLLDDYDVTYDDVLSQLEGLVIIRKEFDEYTFTIRLSKIIENASSIALRYDSQEVGSEHLFLSLLEISSVARAILEMLEIDINMAIGDLVDIFNWEEKENMNSLTRNITKMAENNELEPFFGREEYIKRLDVILNRRTKNNPLLIGGAGVGKTAIVEGLAKHYYENDDSKVIISLDLGSAIAGSKYRGDFEKRILDTIKEAEKNPNYVLFIDEIHTIIGAGSSEGSMDAANLLKPILARRKIKCIGATTLEEYYKHIVNDKALARRFQAVFVEEPGIEETLEILNGLKHHYESYHQVKIKEDVLPYISNETAFRLPNKLFPDKAIDVLDEAMANAKLSMVKCIEKRDVDLAIDHISGVRKNKNFLMIKNDALKKYALNYYLGIENKTILNLYVNRECQMLYDDLKIGFGINDEFILKINLSDYTDQSSLQTLIGSPPGYIGYDNGGILSEHMIKYPISVIVLKSLSLAHFTIQEFFFSLFNNGEFYDKKGRKITSKNTIFVFLEKENDRTIGFQRENKKKSYIDEEIYYDEEKKTSNIYAIRLKSLGYLVEIKSIDPYKAVLELVDKYPKGEYIIEKNNEIIEKAIYK